MTDAPELKPCPWCGGKAYIETLRSENYGYWCEAIGAKCMDCGATNGSFEVEKWEQGIGHYPIRDLATAQATKKWNTRGKETT